MVKDKVMHFSDRTVVVCMLLWCASSRLQGWIRSRGLRFEVIVKLVTLYTWIQSIQLPDFISQILQKDDTQSPEFPL
jgi:hypothetical protein